MRSTVHVWTAYSIGLCFALCGWCVQPCRAATAEQVQQAIEKGTKYLYAQMKGDNWEATPARDPAGSMFDTRGSQWGGTTALCTYALLAAGESAQDPRLAKAIEFLRNADLVSTYGISLRAQVWPRVPRNDLILKAIAKDATLLYSERRTLPPNPGEFGYLNQGPGVLTDHSNSQYGVLGLWACSDLIEGISPAFWQQVDSSWRADQADDGSWAYREKPGAAPAQGGFNASSPTMTAAGIATLFITQDQLYRERGIDCAGNIIDPNIEKGLQWMAKHFQEIFTVSYPFYGLYGIERIGVASGYKYFGDVDWYERGADFLLQKQNAQGGFSDSDGSVNNTCFALLFLARGRAPVMMNKLNYSSAGKAVNWNERPRDLANVAHWTGRQIERDLNWQVSTIDSPVRDWHDSPILYMTGDAALNFTAEQQQKLKQFIEEGGLVVGSADCGKRAFADSFRKLGTALFKVYEFAPLQPNNIILHDEQFNGTKWFRKPRVLGMSNGARELMLLLPDADPSRSWQLEDVGAKPELFQLADDIYLYSVSKTEMYVKGDSYIVEPDAQLKASSTVDLARIVYEGNWDPEPGGWTRLAAILHNGDSIDLNLTAIDPAKDSLAGKKIAHLTGTAKFKLSDAAIAALQKFVSDGGTLIVDSTGGKTAFSESAEKVLLSIFGSDADQLKSPLSADQALYQIGGALSEVRYRTFARTKLGMIKGPRLRGIVRDGRLVCIYSPEDLSVGLVGTPVDGIIGYAPTTATELMRKIILSAAGLNPGSSSLLPPPPQASSSPGAASPPAAPPDIPVLTPKRPW
jgi:hypothetical protein